MMPPFAAATTTTTTTLTPQRSTLALSSDDDHADNVHEAALPSTTPPPFLLPDEVDSNNEDCLFEQKEQDVVAVQLLDGRYLHLHQYHMAHLAGGRLHSTVLQGGLALLRYLLDTYVPVHDHDRHRHLTILDLGRGGTGVVGLGVAAATKGRARVVMCTDNMPAAVPLLRHNVSANGHFWSFGAGRHVPRVGELTWGDGGAGDCSTADVCALLLSQNVSFDDCRRRRRNDDIIVVTGADIVYRQSLFVPLLRTLAELDARLHQPVRPRRRKRDRTVATLSSSSSTTVHFLLACQSLRTHVNEFWTLCRKLGFAVELVQVVELSPTTPLALATATTLLRPKSDDHDQHTDNNCQPYRTLPSLEFPPRENRVYVVAIHKLPYTFVV